jgi:hypothetical protein
MLPSPLDIIGHHILPRNCKNCSLFTATCINSPSARCVSAANHVAKTLITLGKLCYCLKEFLI